MIKKLGYGTWGLGGKDYGPINEQDAYKLLSFAYDKGIKFFDTAPLYGLGQSERALGKLIQRIDRKKIIICSKCGMKPHKGFKMNQDFSENYVANDINKSLERLKTSYLDVVLLHSPEINQDISGALNLLIEYKKKKIIKNFGISVRSPNDIIKYKDKNITYFEINFNLLDQRLLNIDKKLLNNKKIIARTPLNFGFLASKDYIKSDFTNFDHRKNWSNEQIENWNLYKKVFWFFSNKYKYKEFSHFALKYVISNKIIDFVIPGMLSKEEIHSNVNVALGGKISKDDLIKINKLYNSIENYIFIQKRKR